MGTHVFVDEYKERGYLLVAAVLPSSALAASRQAIRSHVMPRQRRVHFKKESDARRSKILDTIANLGVRATVYDASSYPDQVRGRAACLTSLVADLPEMDARRLVLETDDAAVHADRTLLYELVRKFDLADQVRYDHLRAREESLLSIPDALAWCWGRGGPWRVRVRPLVDAWRRL